MTPAGMVYNGKCAAHQAQRRGVNGVLAHTQAYSSHNLGQQYWGCGWSQFATLMHPNLLSPHPGHTPEMTPAGMVYNGRCATDQA